ncbi:MAG: ankyrin repeat domain-containing protein [Candidatus Babeliales bacterium]|nr:ankyrin repeat domain-containing protein [Candidatus Babeliales bacterium]
MKRLYFFSAILASIIFISYVHAAPIHYAAKINDTKSLKKYIQFKDQVDQAGNRPLHYAAMFSHFASIQLLIEEHASLNCTDSIGRTPMHYVAQYGSAKTLHYLLARDASIKAQDRITYATPIHYAISENNIQTFEILVKLIDPNIVTKLNRTILHWAVMFCRPVMVEKIVNNSKFNGIRNSLDGLNYRALDMAKEFQSCASSQETYNDLQVIINLLSQDLQVASDNASSSSKAKEVNAQSSSVAEMAPAQSKKRLTLADFNYMKKAKEDAEIDLNSPESCSNGQESASVVPAPAATYAASASAPSYQTGSKNNNEHREPKKTEVVAASSAVPPVKKQTTVVERPQIDPGEFQAVSALNRAQKKRALLASASSVASQSMKEQDLSYDEEAAQDQQEDQEVSNTQDLDTMQQAEEEEKSDEPAAAQVVKKKNKKKKNKKKKDVEDWETEFATQPSDNVSTQQENITFVQAINSGNLNVVMQMIETNNQVIYFVDDMGRLPIHYAAMTKKIGKFAKSILQVLLIKGQETFLQIDHDERSAFDLLKETCNDDIIAHVVCLMKKGKLPELQHLQRELVEFFANKKKQEMEEMGITEEGMIQFMSMMQQGMKDMKQLKF